MAGSIGNKNALGNEGGRPPFFENTLEDIERLSDLCEGYFEHIKGEYREDEEGDEETGFRVKKEWIRYPENPTITGLTLFLGFESKTSLYEYSKKIEFMHLIKRAITRIEQFHELKASDGDKCTGNIFILKNFGWKDTISNEHSGEINNPSAPPSITFKKFNDEQ